MFWKRIWPVLLLALALIGCTEGEADPVPGNSYAAEDFVVADGFLAYDGDAPSYVGVDVSSYQGEIDWERVAEAGVDFAMVRLGFRGYTEGGLYEDDRFRENLEGAMAAGLDVGVYFFFHSHILSEFGNVSAPYALIIYAASRKSRDFCLLHTKSLKSIIISRCFFT